MTNIITVIGARPQFIKSAPVSAAMVAQGVDEFVIHTGQHYDAAMSDVFFSQLKMKQPDARLESGGLTHGAMTGKMLTEIEQILVEKQPDAVLVYGDTNSTLAGALAASKLHIPVLHVESGLRSYNKTMPEELNRIMTDHISEFLFCPTKLAIDNLLKENVRQNVFHVGDVMYDATLNFLDYAVKNSNIIRDLSLMNTAYGVVTVHREENTSDVAHFQRIVAFLQAQASSLPLIFPAHPRTTQFIQKHQIDMQGIRLIPPVGYLDMTLLLNQASLVLTDSGGVQKEAYFHKVPCITIREETEWVETIEHGWNRLWQTDSYLPRTDIDDFGEGDSASKIVEIINQQI